MYKELENKILMQQVEETAEYIRKNKGIDLVEISKDDKKQ